MRIFVSACLMGIYCRYDGREKENAAVLALGLGIAILYRKKG